jgi:pectin methylesterase-like acyl-CoA thioesterase
VSGQGHRRAVAQVASLAAVLAAGLALAACETITVDVAGCAEATARLEACCPGLSARTAICDDNFSLGAAEARCVEAIDCGELGVGTTNTVCADAATRFDSGARSDGGLCP